MPTGRLIASVLCGALSAWTGAVALGGGDTSVAGAAAERALPRAMRAPAQLPKPPARTHAVATAARPLQEKASTTLHDQKQRRRAGIRAPGKSPP